MEIPGEARRVSAWQAPTLGALRRSRRTVLAGLSSLPLLALGACGGSGDDDDEPVASPTTAPTTPSTRTAVPNPPSPTTRSSPAASVTANSGAYFPPATGTWEKADPLKTGWSPSGLEKIRTLVGDNKSSTFMMLSGGRILAENYFRSATVDTYNDVASVQKSVKSTLIGIAREKGLLTLDDRVSKYLAAGWSKASAADEGKITVLHLLTHTSGLDPKTLRKVAEPGVTFDYNTDAYQKLRPVLEKAAGMNINQISRAWMFDAIGATTGATWMARPDAEKDATGAVVWGLAFTARDMARFGLLALRRGQWTGTQLVNASWFEEAWASSKAQPDYGLLWWLMGKKQKFARDGAPKDWVAALGAKDQKIYVVPSMDLVVTRQGLAAGEESEHESDFDAVLFKAIAAARA